MNQREQPHQYHATMTVVAALFVVTLAVNLQVPLYKTYADLAGYRQGLVSVTFAAYVAGLIPALLLLGGFAERFGNKIALLFGSSLALGAHVLIIRQPTIQTLLETRLLQGLSVGLCLSAGTAYLVELGTSPRRAARLSSLAVTLGLGCGGLLTSASLALSTSLAPSSYYAVAVATFVVGCALSRLKAGRSKHGAALIRMPHVSSQTLPFGLGIFLSWSLTGIILAAIPNQLVLIGQGRWSGLIVFVAIATGVLVQLGPEVRQPMRFLRIGRALVLLAVLLLLVGVHARSGLLLLVAASASGSSSFGFTYVGGLTGTLLACPADRARAVSGYYLLGYSGFGLPCVAVGYLTERWGLESALVGYALALLSGCALWRVVVGVRGRHVSAL